MKSFYQQRKVLFALCLSAALALGACGGDDSSSGESDVTRSGEENGDGSSGGSEDDDGSGGNEGDAGSGGNEGDAGNGDNEDDAGNGDNGDDAGNGGNDGGDDDAGNDGGEDGAGDSCELDSVDVLDASSVSIKEMAHGWEYHSDTGAQIVTLYLSSDEGHDSPGTVEFEDIDLDEQPSTLLVGDGCDSSGCDTLYRAIGGSVEVSAFSHDDGGAFESMLHSVELVEVSEDYRGEHERVDGGSLGCLDALALDATTELRAPFPESADIACDHNGFPHPSDSGSAAVTTPMIVNDGQLMVTTVTGFTQPYDSMTLSIDDKLAGAATSVGTYQFDDYNKASCVNCLIIRADCDAGCSKTFIAGRGNLRVTSAEYANDSFVPDELFSATLSNVALVEVEIDPNTQETEIVAGGETWCIDQFNISETVQQP